MRKSILLFFAILLVLFSSPATAFETLAQSIVKHRDFFAQLNGYSDCLLIDVEVIDRKSIGIILLSPEGFEQHFVFETTSIIPIYANARILNKKEREFLMDTSIKMSEVKKLAMAAKTRAEELRRGWTVYEGKPGNTIPRNPFANKTEPNQTVEPVASAPAMNLTHHTRGHILNVSKEINEEVAAMSTEDILKRFRAEVKKYSQSENVA